MNCHDTLASAVSPTRTVDSAGRLVTSIEYQMESVDDRSDALEFELPPPHDAESAKVTAIANQLIGLQIGLKVTTNQDELACSEKRHSRYLVP